jgi:hypothetical protein
MGKVFLLVLLAACRHREGPAHRRAGANTRASAVHCAAGWHAPVR